MLEKERRVCSQNGEDGVIEHIFELIGTNEKYYFEIGAGNGGQNNTRNLLLNHGFNGLLIDSEHEVPEVNLHREFITCENLKSILTKYKVPKQFDFFSLDVDFNDWYILRDFLKLGYTPNVICVECNAKWSHTQDKVVQYNANQRWDRSDYFGASVLAFSNLGKKYGYSFVYLDNTGTNMFFVKKKFANLFENADNVKALYVKPKYGNGGHPDDHHKREYLKSVDLLKDEVQVAEPTESAPVQEDNTVDVEKPKMVYKRAK